MEREGEVSLLIDGFNEMLSQIQDRTRHQEIIFFRIA